LNRIETIESLEAAIETIVSKMAICEFYANVYVETIQMGLTLASDQMTRRLQESLDSALPQFYAAVLVFSAKARQYFDPSNTGGWLSAWGAYCMMARSDHRLINSQQLRK